jgi:hypothetical protein
MNNEENPCKKLAEELFMQSGYPTDKGCMVCGKKPARITDTWFNLTVCIEHNDWSPIRIQEYLKNKK